MGYILSFIGGAVVGIVYMSLCVAAKRGDNQ